MGAEGDTIKEVQHRGREKDACCSCERLLVNDTIGAKSKGWGNCNGNKERVAGDQRSGRGGWAAHAAGDGAAAARGSGRWNGMATGGGFASDSCAFQKRGGSRRSGELGGCGLEAADSERAAR